MLFFDLIIRWVESSDSGPKSDDFGHRILKSDFIPSDIAKSDCISISRPILFSNRKLKIRCSESDRIINETASGRSRPNICPGVFFFSFRKVWNFFLTFVLRPTIIVQYQKTENKTVFPFIVLKPTSSAVGGCLLYTSPSPRD